MNINNNQDISKLLSFRFDRLTSGLFNHGDTLIASHGSQDVDDKAFEFFSEEIVVSISWPYRLYMNFGYKDKVFNYGENLVIKINKEGMEYFHDDNVITLFLNRDMMMQIGCSSYAPVFSFQLNLYSLKHKPATNTHSIVSMSTINDYHYCKIMFGAFHLSLSHILDNIYDRVFKGRFEQVINDGEYQHKKFGELELFVKASDHVNLFKSCKELVDRPQEDLLVRGRDMRRLELVHKNVFNKLNTFMNKSELYEYNDFYYTSSNRYVLPVEFFQLLALGSFNFDKNLFAPVHVPEMENYFLNIISLKERLYCTDQNEFWNRIYSMLSNRKTNSNMKYTTSKDKANAKFVNEKLSPFIGDVIRSVAVLLPFCSDYSFKESVLTEDDVYNDVYTEKCGDCEDFALSVYRTIEMFGLLESDNKKLNALKRYLTLFVPFMGRMIVNEKMDGNIPITEMTLHTVCFLIPTSKIKLDFKWNPQKECWIDIGSINPILLDATSRNKMVFNDVGHHAMEYEKDFFYYYDKYYNLITHSPNGIQRYLSFETDIMLKDVYLDAVKSTNGSSDGSENRLFDSYTSILKERKQKNQVLESNQTLTGGHPFYKYIISLQTNYFIHNGDESDLSLFYFVSDQSTMKTPVDFSTFMGCSNVSSKILLTPTNKYTASELIEFTSYLHIEKALSFPVYNFTTQTNTSNIPFSTPLSVLELNITGLSETRKNEMIDIVSKYSGEIELLGSFTYCQLDDVKFETIVYKIK